MYSRMLGMQIGAALAELAMGCESPDDVARRLKRHGCEGPRSACGDCPVWIWLARDLGIDPERDTLTVTHDEAALVTRDGLEGRRPVPPVVGQFIGRFDGDCYPELIKEG